MPDCVLLLIFPSRRPAFAVFNRTACLLGNMKCASSSFRTAEAPKINIHGPVTLKFGMLNVSLRGSEGAHCGIYMKFVMKVLKIALLFFTIQVNSLEHEKVFIEEIELN